MTRPRRISKVREAGHAPAASPYEPLFRRATDISSQTRADLYVVLTEREACELVAADDKLIRNFQ